MITLSQGGVKVPTGGKHSSANEARERFTQVKVSRSGVIPGPTVIVRMGESQHQPGEIRPSDRISSIICAGNNLLRHGFMTWLYDMYTTPKMPWFW
ncbi:hypothetical protein OA40_12470 [Morganella morganii]|nr:hypothetical protein OA40_12470 [Morganella morganii]